MQKIILILLSATLLLATGVTTMQEETKPKMRKHVKITADIEAEIAKKELNRLEKTKVREDKIKKVDTELKEKAIKRAEA